MSVKQFQGKHFPTHIVSVDGVVENDGKILLVKNRDKGNWSVPGGQVENGENLEDALVREIKEESGIDVSVGKLICVTSNTGTYEGHSGYGMVPTKVMFGFTCTFKGGGLCTSDETSDVRWVPKSEVLSYITYPALRIRFEAYLSYNGRDIQYLEYVTKPDYELKLERHI